MPANIRSSLKPYFHKKRRKWYPRGTFPYKTEDGRIERKRGFLGTGSDTRTACQAECDRLNAELEREATAGRVEPTFEEAAEVYLSTGGDGRFLHDRLLDAIGHYRVDAITDAVMHQARMAVYPNATQATLNRQLFTPVISVLRQASKGRGWKPDLTRPKGALKLKPAKSPPDDWFARFRDASSPQLWAFVLFLTLHGRRPSDALRATPAHFDPGKGTVFIDKTKNGEPMVVKLSAPALDAILAFNWQEGPGLFGTLNWKNRRGAYRQLKTACARAGIPYFTFHKAGRHKFAKRLLEEGYSLAHVKASGGWKSMKVVGELYGALAADEVADATKRVGDVWAAKLHAQDNVVPLPRKGANR